MASATAIFDVSSSLETLLQAQLSVFVMPPNTVKVESIDLVPDPVQPPRISIYLFNIVENPFLKNMPGAVVASGPGAAMTSPPPAVLDLDFMICAWMSTTKEEHMVLGDVVRVLYDNSELGPVQLGAFWAADEAVQLSLANLSLEDQTRIWTSFGFKRFKLALYYKAKVVPIASLRTFAERVVLDRGGAPTTFVPPLPGDLPAGVA
jgi:hypothetical protein